ncbi:MAG: hypothetical protein V7603_6668 [Micromonosporaceae bacterium]
MRCRLVVGLRTWCRRPAAQDSALAVALLAACVLVNAPNAVLTVTGARLDGGPALHRDLWWAATVLAVVAIALRRHVPLAALAACTLSAAVHTAESVPFMTIDFGVPILLYTVAVRFGRTLSLAILSGLLLLVLGWSLYAAVRAVPVPGLPTSIATGPGAGTPFPPAQPQRTVLQDAWSGVLVLGSALVASWAMGSGARSRGAYLDMLHAHAQDLERDRDQQAALAVAAERGRISRELHDIVAHGLSVMVTQAQGADAALDKWPADTRTALGSIVKTGRDSLTEMRRVLARVDGVEDSWHPQPGLDQLPALVAQVTQAGTPVRLRVEGTRAPLPPAVDLSAYRIVQEALTNTMKHAGTAAIADVVLVYGDAEVIIDVNDDGGGVTHRAGGGNGLRGMRERVRLLGGQFVAGPGPTGGFALRAVLPIHGPHA